jgi:hypothetical protein
MYDFTLQGVIETVLPNHYIYPYVYDSLYRLVCNTYADSLQDQLHLVALYDAKKNYFSITFFDYY